MSGFERESPSTTRQMPSGFTYIFLQDVILLRIFREGADFFDFVQVPCQYDPVTGTTVRGFYDPHVCAAVHIILRAVRFNLFQ